MGGGVIHVHAVCLLYMYMDDCVHDVHCTLAKHSQKTTANLKYFPRDNTCTNCIILNLFPPPPPLLSLPSAMKPVEIQEKLALTKLRDRQWYVQPSCATTGDGLYEGLTWLTSNRKSK